MRVDALPDATAPRPDAIPTPAAVGADSGAVVWHRDGLRTRDHPALAAAARAADAICPLFVFDPGFYGDDGLACDARIRFLHDCLTDLDEQYRTRGGGDGGREADADPCGDGGRRADADPCGDGGRGADADPAGDGGRRADADPCGATGSAGLTYAHGDPVDVLAAFDAAGWDVFAARTPTGRYGERRDERAREAANVTFVSGDGVVRGADRTREGWGDRLEAWLTDDPYAWDPDAATVHEVPTGVTIDAVERAYDTTPTKSQVPTGGTGPARERLRAFAERIRSYPRKISSPLDARGGTSGLSPYLKFGCLSVREVYRYLAAHAPDCRGRELFVSRLYWNKHYEQKLEDWSGWLDEAVNPALRWFNRDRYDPNLVAAWKAGRTGYPMVDASMRCLRETGWLNFRMRAMCVSVYYHVLQQPWRIGADWYHHHLIDSVASINYTQWQCQCGLVGKPGLRLYNPRKQVRDQDPDGEFVRRWVPELADLPADHLPRPEKTPLHVQADCGVSIGDGPDDDYPYPVREYEAATEEFWTRYEAVAGEAASRLGDEAIARRASLSGGLAGARSIAAEHGTDDDPDAGTQADLTAFE